MKFPSDSLPLPLQRNTSVICLVFLFKRFDYHKKKFFPVCQKSFTPRNSFKLVCLGFKLVLLGLKHTNLPEQVYFGAQAIYASICVINAIDLLLFIRFNEVKRLYCFHEPNFANDKAFFLHLLSAKEIVFHLFFQILRVYQLVEGLWSICLSHSTTFSFLSKISSKFFQLHFSNRNEKRKLFVSSKKCLPTKFISCCNVAPHFLVLFQKVSADWQHVIIDGL